MTGDRQSTDVRRLASLTVPAIIIGVGCALTLILLDGVAEGLQHLIWKAIPGWAGVDTQSWWWMLGTLTLTGALVGLIVWRVPGHAGPDPATLDLIDRPLPLRVLP